MVKTAGPTFRELTRAECDEILSRNHVGRIAFTFHDRVDVEPITYTYAGSWLHARTSPGTKLALLRHHPWVAFEVDEVQAIFDWQSVVVHGVVHIPHADGSADDRAAHADILTHLRELVPETLGPNDPVPERIVLFRVHVDEVRGRAATTRGNP